ncbi:hypothetical protein PC128_g23518 [Phytophthora cactorum]|nr:hypothetical protein PC128_g23518 [Phytophthora cactorum]
MRIEVLLAATNADCDQWAQRDSLTVGDDVLRAALQDLSTSLPSAASSAFSDPGVP